jgi:hypothetical protein
VGPGDKVKKAKEARKVQESRHSKITSSNDSLLNPVMLQRNQSRVLLGEAT